MCADLLLRLDTQSSCPKGCLKRLFFPSFCLADELFFCGSTYEVSPTVVVDAIAVGSSDIGTATTEVWAEYEALVRGQSLAHAEWRIPAYDRQSVPLDETRAAG